MTDANGNRHQVSLPIMQDSSAPPKTRAECASIARPCNRYSCRYHLWPQTERAGRPHKGTHNLPTGVFDALARAELADGKVESCALDVATADGPIGDDGFPIEGVGKERTNAEVATFLPAPTQSRKKRKARVAGDVDIKTKGSVDAEITKERIRQIVERGLNKQWGAMTLVQALEDFHTEFASAGGSIDFLWGTIVDPADNESDANAFVVRARDIVGDFVLPDTRPDQRFVRSEDRERQIRADAMKYVMAGLLDRIDELEQERAPKFAEVKNDAGRIYVTIALNTTKVVRPRREEIREMKRMGVAVRRKIT